jgi:hypothetical protein
MSAMHDTNDNTNVTIDLQRIPSGTGKKSLPASKKKKQGPSNRSKGVTKKNWKLDHEGGLEAALMAPDLFGPVRVPRYGNSDRTVLCEKKLRTAFGYSATNAVQGIVLKTSYSGAIAARFEAVNNNTNSVGIAGVNADITYPPAANLTDVSLVSACMTIIYTGKPLDAQGEVTLVTLPDNAGTVNETGLRLSTLGYLPNAVIVPVSSLLDKPMRVSLLHQSPSSWDFNAIAQEVVDVATPVLAVNGLASGTNVTVEITCCYEGRSAFSASNAIPFEGMSESKAQDLSIFEDVVANMGELYNQVSEFIPTGYASNFINGVKSSAAGFVANSATGLGQHLTNRVLGTLNSHHGSEFRRILF